MTKIVEVDWVDAFIDTDDFTLEKATKLQPIPRKTIGYLVVEDKDRIVLATDIFPDKKDEYSACMVIPKPWIRKRIVVRK